MCSRRSTLCRVQAVSLALTTPCRRARPASAPAQRPRRAPVASAGCSARLGSAATDQKQEGDEVCCFESGWGTLCTTELRCGRLLCCCRRCTYWRKRSRRAEPGPGAAGLHLGGPEGPPKTLKASVAKLEGETQSQPPRRVAPSGQAGQPRTSKLIRHAAARRAGASGASRRPVRPALPPMGERRSPSLGPLLSRPNIYLRGMPICGKIPAIGTLLFLLCAASPFPRALF